MSAPTHLGRKIEELMALKGWDSQAQIADAVEGLQRSTVSRVMNGKVDPDLATLDMIATALGAPLEALIQAALLDLTGKERSLSLSIDEDAEMAVLVQTYPWLRPVVRELASLSVEDRRGILAYLHAQRVLREGQSETE